MARLARNVFPEIPHHITQRGNRRQNVFFEDADYEEYLYLMRKYAELFGVEIWSYCLMTNHVHFIAKPSSSESLTSMISEVHRRYSRAINFREGWRGHLWQGRYFSYPMDMSHTLLAARYIELNPVSAKMVVDFADYQWSSANENLGLTEKRFMVNEPEFDGTSFSFIHATIGKKLD